MTELTAPFAWFGGKRRVADVVWRAVKADPDRVAEACDWPVSEVDLHARHQFIVLRLKEAIMTPDTLGCRVRRFRFRKGWTLKQLAQEAQLSKSFLSTIENGKSQPTGRVLLRLANALETSVDFLIQGSQVKETQPYSELELRIARLEYEVGIRRGDRS